MNFKKWFEANKGTANLFRSLLQDVPQNTDFHPEGDVLAHTRLVRKAIPRAIQAIQSLQLPVMSNIDFSVSPEEVEILAMASWLHDIGKHTATQIQPSGKITSYGHQDYDHFMPQIEKFSDIASDSTKEFYLRHKEIIDFLITHHMDFMSNNGFPKKFRAAWTDNEGKLKPDPRIKLLLILMMADKMGRGMKSGESSDDVHQKAIDFNKNGLEKTYEKSLKQANYAANNNSVAFQGNKEQFINMLKSKGLPENIIKKSVEKKFGSY